MLLHLVYRVPVSTGILIGMSHPPREFRWEHLRARNITHLVSLCEVEENRDVTPVRLLYSCALQDISGDEHPETPKVMLWNSGGPRGMCGWL